MPQWEGIEDASAVAAPVWLSRPVHANATTGGIGGGHVSSENADDHSTGWTPLRKDDCQALNQAMKNRNEDDASSMLVYIEGGRCTADLRTNRIAYNFIRGCGREFYPATWFIRHEEGKTIALEPIFHQDEAANIERLYQNAVEATSSLGKGVASILREEVTLNDGSTVKVMKLSSGHLCMRKQPSGWLNQINRNTFTLQRGYGEYCVEGESNEVELGPMRHLVFIIHGIGEAMWSRETVALPSMLELTDQLRLAIQAKQIQEWRKECSCIKNDTDKPSPPGRIEFIPIEWFHHLHSEDKSWVQTLRATTLPTIPALRALANDVILDVLLYMTPQFCERVLDSVTQQITDIFGSFLEVHPRFDGTCSIMGHSLGSVIAWDLLSILKDAEDRNSRSVSIEGTSFAARDETSTKATGTWGPSLPKVLTKTIPFVPEHTIFLGSPVGMFLTLRGAHEAFDAMRLKTSPSRPCTVKGRLESSNTHGVTSAGESISSGFAEVGPPLVSPFTLPTRSLYSIFHPSDPIAYRIEPLLLPLNLAPEIDLPPPVYLTVPGKDVRLHIKAKQIGEDILKKTIKAQSSWTTLLTSVLSSAAIETPSSLNRALADGSLVFPLGGLSSRIDYALQTSVVDNEYISAVTAHGTYFSNTDLHDFLVALFGEKFTRM